MSTPAPAPAHARWLRGVVLGCLLGGLLVAHVAVRYLVGTLFGFVTYRELAPVVPFLVLGGYALLLVGLAASAARRWGLGPTSVAFGLGALLLAIEPVTSAVLWGDGCEVANPAGGSLLPEVAVDGLAVVLFAWDGACAVSLATVHVGGGLLLVGGGCWAAGAPDAVLTRWLRVLDRERAAAFME